MNLPLPIIVQTRNWIFSFRRNSSIHHWCMEFITGLHVITVVLFKH